MSARSIKCLRAKGQQVGLPIGQFHRRYKYVTEGASTYMPPKPLGWFFVNPETGKEYFPGATMDDALVDAVTSIQGRTLPSLWAG
jgi:hypothetical protein